MEILFGIVFVISVVWNLILQYIYSKREKELLDRLMSRTYPEFVSARVQESLAEASIKKLTQETSTTENDKAKDNSLEAFEEDWSDYEGAQR